MQSLIYSCRVSKEIYSFLLLVHQSLNHHYLFSKCYTGLRGHQWRSFSFENKLYINTQFTEGSSVSLHQLMLFSSLWILFSYQPLLPPMLGDGGWGGSLIESGSWCHNLIGGRHMHFSSLWILSSYQPLLPPMLGDGGWGALWIENSIELGSWCHNLIGGRNMHFSFLNSVLVTTSSSPMLGDGG